MLTCNVTAVGCTGSDGMVYGNENQNIGSFMASALLYPLKNPPASGIGYIASKFQDTELFPSAYAAQGLGLASLTPFKAIWEIFRNFSIILLIFIIMSIGFMIMFRKQIDPQTVITVESAIPKLVITILLITFSMPIAGLMIDLMYVLTGLIVSLLATHPVIESQPYYDALYGTNDLLFGGGIWFLFVKFMDFRNYFYVGNAVFEIFPLIFQLPMRFVFGGILAFIVAPNIPVLGSLFKPQSNTAILVTGPLAIILYTIAFLVGFSMPAIIITGILITSAIYTFARLFAMMYKAYFKTVLYIFFAPLIFLFEVIPGKTVFVNWLGTIAANLLIFPVTIALLIISSILMQTETNGQAFFQPPFISVNSNTVPQGLAMLMGLVMLFSIPNIYESIKELLGSQGFPINLSVSSLGGAAATYGGVSGLYKSIPLPIRKYLGLNTGIGKMLDPEHHISERNLKAMENLGKAMSGKTPPA